MLYFFDIHLHGETCFDDSGQEFHSLSEARDLAISSACSCLDESKPHIRALLRRSVIEIVAADGSNDFILIADCPSLRPCRGSVNTKQLGGRSGHLCPSNRVAGILAARRAQGKRAEEYQRGHGTIRGSSAIQGDASDLPNSGRGASNPRFS